MKLSTGMFCAAVAALGMLSVGAAESQIMHLYCSSNHDLAWSTISTRSADIALTWPFGASKARISVKDAMSCREVAAGTAKPDESSWRWTVFSGEAPAADGCFSVTATYFAGETELSSETATIVLHKGTFAPVDVYSTPQGLSFARIRSGKAIAYNSRWFAARTPPMSVSVTERADGDYDVFALGPSVNGYLLWNPNENGNASGWYDFVLSCGGDSIVGRALLGYEGTRITVR